MDILYWSRFRPRVIGRCEDAADVHYLHTTVQQQNSNDIVMRTDCAIFMQACINLSCPLVYPMNSPDNVS